MAIFRKKATIVKQEEKLPDIKVIENEALKEVTGQNKAIRQITMALYKAKYFKALKSNLLIVGNNVAAKKIVRSVAKSLEIPYIQAKYYALDANIVCKLYENANYDLQKAQKGIIVIEDIDKRIENVLAIENFINFLESTDFSIEVTYGRNQVIMPFKTKNIMLIFLGKFDGVGKIRDKRINKTSMGFGEKVKSTNEAARITKQDIADFDIPEEVLDKIDIIVEMDRPSKEQISTRLNKSKISAFRKYQKELEKKGVSLAFDERIFDVIAESSLKSDKGGKDVIGTINYIFENITYDVLTNPGKFKKCEISLDIVKDNTKYKLS